MDPGLGLALATAGGAGGDLLEPSPMRPPALDALACPACRVPLRLQEPSPERGCSSARAAG